MTAPEPGERLAWSIAWRIARRDLAARFRGLRLLLACLFLGTLALAAIGTLTGAVEHELTARGQVLLGGDLELAVYAREASTGELAAMRALGRVSAGQRLQAMAVVDRDPSLAVPVELKAVDAAWPLYGRLILADGRVAGAPRGMAAWIAPGVADRMGVKVGDVLRLGAARVTIGGVIADEPDRLGEGFSLGAAVIVSQAALEASRLVQPGSMVRAKYRLRLPPGGDPAAAGERFKRAFPDGGWTIRDRSRASPGLENFVSRLGQFLTLVALTALAIAGIGIAHGVGSYLEARRGGIATLKILGATGGDIARIYLLQIGAAAAIAIAAGLAVAVALTPLLAQAIGGLLPVASGLVVEPWALLRAALFAVLVAAVFAAPPLLRARGFPAMALLRARVTPLAAQWKALALPVGGGLAAIAVLAIAGASEPLLTAGFLAGAAALFALLTALGRGIAALAARLPRPRDPIARMALANLHRPGAQTGALVTALGFGLAAFVLLAAVQTSLDGNIAQRVPAKAPDYFVLDLPPDGVGTFAALVERAAPGAQIRTVPTLRGAILAYGPAGRMVRVADLDDLPEGAWALRGERGLTFADSLPAGNVVTAGRWWPAGWRGAPLVSVDQDLADAIGLKVGDRLTIALLGVERTATVASLRRIDWDSLGFNHVLVFSPNAIADAPHNLAATVALGGQADRRALLSGIVR
ncbi:MAG: ABC transporter permease, partial [Novosphingobium sp.]